jgi:hypothetical protein
MIPTAGTPWPHCSQMSANGRSAATTTAMPPRPAVAPLRPADPAETNQQVGISTARRRWPHCGSLCAPP